MSRLLISTKKWVTTSNGNESAKGTTDGLYELYSSWEI